MASDTAWPFVIAHFKELYRNVIFVFVTVVATYIIFMDEDNPRAMKCLYILIVMSISWITEFMPLPVTAMIPLVAFPLAEISDTNSTAKSYVNSTIFMFIGGLILAIGIEDSGLHERIALRVLRNKFLRTRNWGIMCGFMLVTACLSMFISNTATVAMMIPIVKSVCKSTNMDNVKRDMLLLSIAYSANIGGTAVVTGSPPNLVVLKELSESEVTFLRWIGFCMPLAFFNLMIAFAWLQFVSLPWITKWSFLNPTSQERLIKYDSAEKEQDAIEKVAMEEAIKIEAVATSDSNVSAENGLNASAKNGLNVSNASVHNEFPLGSMNSVSSNATVSSRVEASNQGSFDPIMPVEAAVSVKPAAEDKIEQSQEEAEDHEVNPAAPVEPSTKEAEAKIKECEDEILLAVLDEKLASHGEMKSREYWMLFWFIVLVLLWSWRDPKFITHGWAYLFEGTDADGNEVRIGSATPAILVVLIIFVIPRTWKFFPFVRKAENVQRSDPLVTWEVVESKLPWGVVLLLGGGFALSEGCTKSGLSNWIAVRLQGLDGLPPAGINLLMSMAAATVTEFVSNTATANILIPILKQFSYSLCLNPVYLVMTTVISCSYAFMLPVATAPNALVHSKSTIKISYMMSVGFFMNLICIVTTNLAINLYGSGVFGDFYKFPEWALAEAAEAGYNCTIPIAAETF